MSFYFRHFQVKVGQTTLSFYFKNCVLFTQIFPFIEPDTYYEFHVLWIYTVPHGNRLFLLTTLAAYRNSHSHFDSIITHSQHLDF